MRGCRQRSHNEIGRFRMPCSHRNARRKARHERDREREREGEREGEREREREERESLTYR